MKKSLILLLACCIGSIMAQEVGPPVAKKIPNQLIIHSDTLIDHYYWMRDKHSAEFINYLYAENAYSERKLKGKTLLQKALYEELRSHYREKYASRPTKVKNFYYYYKYSKGENFPKFFRKKDSLTKPEKLVLDLNQLAEQNSGASVRDIKLSPDNRYVYYAIDEKGDRILHYYLKDIEADSVTTIDELPGIMSLTWAQNNQVVYYIVPEPKTLREYRLYRHVLGSSKNDDQLIYEEKDPSLHLELSLSSSKKYLFIGSVKTKSSEFRYMPADGSASTCQLFLARRTNLLYEPDHTEGDEFYILHNLDAMNGMVSKTKIQEPDPKKWQTIIPHQDQVLIKSLRFTKQFMFLVERENAQNRLKIINRSNGETEYLDPETSYGTFDYRFIDFDFENSREIEYGVSNLIQPTQTFTYNLFSRESRLVQTDTIPGAYLASNYEIKRILAPSKDGKSIPITLACKKGLKLNGQNPLYLSAYGAYGASSAVHFNQLNIPLLDRGFVVAVAHVRGSDDLGMQWYEDGKMEHKKNTFEDFIACTEHLIAEGYTQAQHIAIEGASAGGLLIGAVLNMRPDLYKCALAGVPFVDVINTMLDESLPLTTFEFEEWGNPKIKKHYEYIRSYSPYENVKAQAYPNLLVRAGYNDSQVSVWEPAKWVARLRDLKTDTNLLLLKTDMDNGHAGISGRYNQLKEMAFNQAFIFHCLNIKDDYVTVKGRITDQKNQEIPFVNVYHEGTTNGTTCNADGEFTLSIKRNDAPTLVFQTLGYKKQVLKIEPGTSVSDLHIQLQSEDVQLNEVIIKANAKDPAYAIMREAVKHRKQNLEAVQSFSANIYLKTHARLLKIPQKIPFFINKKNLPDSSDLGMIYLSESVAKYHFQRPNEVKEEMIASKVAGTKVGYSFNRVEDVFMNFYEPSIKAGFYSERPFISPLSTGSVLNYKYKYLGTFFVDQKPVHKIQISPRRKGDPLFHGEIYISEENYQIYSCDFFITKDAQIDFADTVHIKQEMVKVNDSIWMPLQLQIYSRIRFMGFDANDLSSATISNYTLNKGFPKNFFNNEVFKVEEMANKKDSSYWTDSRPSILSKEENKYYTKRDSILRKEETKEYKDSVAKASRKPGFGIGGIQLRNELKGEYLSVESPLLLTQYNTVEGLNFTSRAWYTRRNKETRQLTRIYGQVHYGMETSRWGAEARFYRLFKPKHSMSTSLKAGRVFTQFNAHEPINPLLNTCYSLFAEQNFMKLYQKDFISLAYGQELFNGLYTNVEATWMQREALNNNVSFTFIDFPDRKFSSNNPLVEKDAPDNTPVFATHQSLQFQAGFKLIPFSRYETYPTHIRLLPNKWLEFSLLYRAGLGLTNVNFNYHQFEAGIGKDIELGLLGEFSFDALAGIFLNGNTMVFADYKHFNGNQTHLLMNKRGNELPDIRTRINITEFHALDYYSCSTNKQYAEIHLTHNFRGLFISKIPLLRKTKVYEMAGMNALFTPDKQYTEVFVGVDKILKIFRFDIGTSLENKEKINLFYRFGFRIKM